MADKKRLDALTAYLQHHGFVWGPAPEIYGGLAGFYTYGPHGAALKRNVEARIRRVFAQYEFFEVETPTILPRKVWEASGHLDGFTDPLIADENGGLHRADQLVEEHYATHGISEPAPTTTEDLLAAITEHDITAPDGTALKDEIHQHNLMMQTTVGTDTEAYNRPETATATYLPFPRYAEHFRKKLPFGVYQIGKAYRNEISPRQHLLRMREFTQAEAQLFINPHEKDGLEHYNDVKDEELPVYSWKLQEAGEDAETMTVQAARKQHFSSDAYAFCIALAHDLFTSFGIPQSRIRLRQHGPDEKAFYAKDAWDVEIDLPTFGWTEVCGVHDRTDYDLTQHGEHSGERTTVYDQERGEHVTPHVLEIAFGVDRPVYALLDIFYDEKDEDEGKTMLRLPYDLAPVQVAVFPLHKKLNEKAKEVFDSLREEGFVCVYDDSGSIGKRYLRANYAGTPLCVTIDFDTVEGEDAPKDTVTIRDRDTEEQDRVAIKDLADEIRERLG